MGISPNHIPYINLQAKWKEEKDDLLPIIEKVLSSGQYIGGEELDKFEENIAKLCGTKYACGLNSGTDALVFALAALGIRAGDEVITPPNSFIASTGAIVHLGAKPVFVDVDKDTLNVNSDLLVKKITNKTNPCISYAVLCFTFIFSKNSNLTLFLFGVTLNYVN